MTPRTGLCVGLDLDVNKLPEGYASNVDGLIRFGCDVIDATRSTAACFKLNLAFYERYGRDGMDALYRVREHCGDAYVIADAKRGDIGNTSKAYADAVFADLQADAITVSPYMGSDSVLPFLEVPNKMVYVLALTSNPGSHDFQRLPVNGKPLFEVVIETAMQWGRLGDIGFVVGATNAVELHLLRQKYPEANFLVPGIGSQGGSETETVHANAGGPAVFNVSRGLLYGGDMAWIAAEAQRLARVTESRFA